MTVSYLKKAAKIAESSDPETRRVVMEMLARIEAKGEAASRDYARELDGWQGDIAGSPDELLEGMDGHAMTGDVRPAKPFPEERFRLDVEGFE